MPAFSQVDISVNPCGKGIRLSRKKAVTWILRHGIKFCFIEKKGKGNQKCKLLRNDKTSKKHRAIFKIKMHLKFSASYQACAADCRILFHTKKIYIAFQRANSVS